MAHKLVVKAANGYIIRNVVHETKGSRPRPIVFVDITETEIAVFDALNDKTSYTCRSICLFILHLLGVFALLFIEYLKYYMGILFGYYLLLIFQSMVIVELTYYIITRSKNRKCIKMKDYSIRIRHNGKKEIIPDFKHCLIQLQGILYYYEA